MGSQTRPTPAGVRPQGDRPGVFEVPPPPALAIISDTRPLDTPAAIAEYSSHRLLWEGIAEELLADPFALQDSPDRFLQTRMRRAKIADENFNRAAFLDVLIANAYQQGLARLLMQLELNVRLFGSGWHRIDAFKAHAAGPVRSRDDLARAVASATALLHVWPSEFAHPIEAMGKAVLRVARRRDAFSRNARAALAGKLSKPATTSDPLTAASILEAFSRPKSSEIHEPIPHV